MLQYYVNNYLDNPKVICEKAKKTISFDRLCIDDNFLKQPYIILST